MCLICLSKMHVGVDYKGALNKKWRGWIWKDNLLKRGELKGDNFPALLPVQKVVQFFSFTGQICFRSDVNTNNLYLLIFTTDVSAPPFVIVRPENNEDRAMTRHKLQPNQWRLLLFFLQFYKWKQLNTNRMEIAVFASFPTAGRFGDE